jgi:ATP-dependent DNA helicase RecQ
MEIEDPINAYASSHFGIRYLYPYQRLVVANVLDALEGSPGSDNQERQIVILPTGAGKSLCFQLPAGLCPGPTLVAYPLLGLMADQLRRLEQTGLEVAVLKGGMSRTERLRAFDSIRSGAARVIITNPEMLAMSRILELLAGAKVFHFVVDEAHCVAEWGDGFRPSYLALGAAINAIKPRIVTAFTATASPPILERVAEILFGSLPYRLVSGIPDRPNIRYEVLPTLSMSRSLRAAVVSLQRPAIVFAGSRKGVELIAEDLRSSTPEIDVRFYHAGLEKEERNALETWFMHSASGVLCATTAYGMGMDKPDIRSVIHFGVPRSVEAYLQESGRAGRDGKPSNALLIRLAVPDDYLPRREGGSRPTETQTIESKTQAMARIRQAAMSQYATGRYGCRRSFLLEALGGEDTRTIACPSCDVCDNTHVSIAAGSEELMSIAARHPRRLNRFQFAGFAKGRKGNGAGMHFGMLGSWLDDEIDEAIGTSIAVGLLMISSTWPWKGRLVPGWKR